MWIKELDVLDANKINNALINKGDIDELYRQNYGLLKQLVKKYNKTDIYDFDEAMSYANIAFVLAVNKYNQERSYFSTFLGVCIKQVFAKYYRDATAKKRDARDIVIQSLTESVYYNPIDAQDILLQDMLEDSTINIENDVITSSLLKDYINYISSKVDGELCLKIIKMRANDYTQTDISKTLKLSQPYISRKLVKIKQYVKEYQAIACKDN